MKECVFISAFSVLEIGNLQDWVVGDYLVIQDQGTWNLNCYLLLF